MNSFDLSALVRDNIKQLKPYSSARDEFSGSGDFTFFDANENALGSVGSATAYHRYPDPYQRAVKAEIARQQGIRPEQIFLGNGSDEAIDLLFRVFCTPGKDAVITMPPTYGMYQVSAEINAIRVVEVPLTPAFEIDTEAVLAAAAELCPKLIFICSPNNPTGNCLSAKAMEAILAASGAIVVIDEAYIDFAPEASVVSWLDRFPNLVVLQTFSKAWGLAAIRLGKAFASPEIIAYLNRVKPPYNVNAPTQAIALDALAAVAERDALVRDILAARAQLAQQLAALEVVDRVFPSDANFLLVRMAADARTVYELLLADGMVVRDRSRVQWCEDCLRITVGTPAENTALLERLLRIERLLAEKE